MRTLLEQGRCRGVLPSSWQLRPRHPSPAAGDLSRHRRRRLGGEELRKQVHDPLALAPCRSRGSCRCRGGGVIGGVDDHRGDHGRPGHDDPCGEGDGRAEEIALVWTGCADGIRRRCWLWWHCGVDNRGIVVDDHDLFAVQCGGNRRAAAASPAGGCRAPDARGCRRCRWRSR